MVSSTISAEQAHALLDILSHYELYQEIRDFRYPGVLDKYGPPFQEKSQTPSFTPSLQTLVSKFLLNLPGLKDVSDDFWPRVSAIIQRFEDVELSESYDKGLIGIRKTLATAASALIEYPARGVFAGFDEPFAETASRNYDRSNAEDLQTSFKDLMHQAVYGQAIDDLVQKIGETDKLSDHTPLVQSAHEFGLVNIASFLHYTLIISPKGQNLLGLIDHANKLVPYTMIKQTLRIGNVATMISAMVKVCLAKMSVSSVTNWMGLTQNNDEGMNLMQHILYQVLHWDVRDLRNKAAKIEKEKSAPKKGQLQALKDYLHKSREEHEDMRHTSQVESKSIVFVILSEAGTSTELSSEQHQLAQEYLANHLALRDREQIIQVLCYSNPDHLTTAVRDLVTAYEPLIRQLHEAVDLSGTVTDFEVFLRDMIKLSKLHDSKAHHHKHMHPPTVGDFVQLLIKHQPSLHKFLHQVVKNGKDITMWFHEYALQSASHFRRTSSTKITSTPNAGNLTEALNELFATLPQDRREEMATLLSEHARYLSKIHAASAARLQSVIDSPSSKPPGFQTGQFSNPPSQQSSRSASPAPAVENTSAGLNANPGPGSFLAKWQDLIDNSEITPAVPEGGEVRSGSKGSVLKASRVGIASKILSKSGPQSTPNTEVNASTSVANANDRSSSKNGGDNDSDDEDVFEEAYERLDQFALGDEEKMAPPDIMPVYEAFCQSYREMLAKRSLGFA